LTTLASAPSTGRRAIPRFEDGVFLRGEAGYVGDLRIDGMLHLAVVRSPYAFGRLVPVDLAAVRALPGVVDAFAAADVPGYLAAIPTRLPVPEQLERFLQPPLAIEEVRYVGQPVAVVVAVSPEAALDATDAVVVEVEASSLPAEEAMHTEEASFGELEKAFEAAAVVVREQFTIGRQAGLPLETRGLLADFDADSGELSVWASAKAPQFLHGAIARALSLAPERVRLHPVDTGGGFGVRGEMHPEDVLVPLAALRVGRPVRWLEGRLEHLQSAYQSRGQTWSAALAVAADGEILGLDATFRGDLGAFIGPNGLTPGRLAIRALPGPYRVPSFRCGAAYVRSCKPPLGTMRGPGYFESAFVRERLLDLAAGELGLDPVEMRRRNLVRAAEQPYATGLDGVVYDGGEYSVTLDRALAEIQGGPVAAGSLEGVGVACVVEGSGTPGIETAHARLDRRGRVTVTLGSSSFGQGHATSFAQVVAGVLSIEPELVEVVEGAREQTGGTFASRSAVMAGSACREAAVALRDAIAAGGAAPLEVSAEFENTAAAYTYGACAARVEVDPETGSVRLLELAVAVDAGVVINAEIVRGQLVGGAVQGAGGALFEELEYSADGEPLTGGLRDYHLPLAADMPEVRTVVLELVPSPRNPLGVRGVGEISTAGAAAAVANAVAAALGAGARVTELPLAPWRLVGNAWLGSTSGTG
jgi:carbon-monoxide dehydrogenase large subunit